MLGEVSESDPGAAAVPEGVTEGEGWQDLFALLDRIPLLHGLKQDLSQLRRLLVGRRVPRVVALGTPGSGRAALGGALLGAPLGPGAARADVTASNEAGSNEAASNPSPSDPCTGRWATLEHGGRAIEWAEVDVGEARPQLCALASLHSPDVLLAVATVAEVEAGFGAVLEVLDSARELFGQSGGAPCPILVVLVVDGDPGEFASEQRERLGRALREASLPASLHVVVRRGGRFEPDAPGIAALASALVDALPEAARLEGGRALPAASAARRRLAATLVRSCATLAVSVALSPLPFSDVAVLAPLQATMVTALAYLSGRPWEPRTVVEWLTSLGLVGAAGLGMRWGAQQLVKIVPGTGSVVSATIAGGGTLTLGRSAARYFLGEDLPRV